MGGKPLSLAAGLAGTAVLRIESAGSVPSVEAVEKLAAVLRVSPCALTYGMDRPFDEAAVGRTASLPDRLRVAREERGLSQNALAQASGIARTTIGYLESGETTPSVATVELLAQALGVSVCWLAYGEGAHEHDQPSATASIDPPHQAERAAPR